MSDMDRPSSPMQGTIGADPIHSSPAHAAAREGLDRMDARTERGQMIDEIGDCLTLADSVWNQALSVLVSERALRHRLEVLSANLAEDDASSQTRGEPDSPGSPPASMAWKLRAIASLLTEVSFQQEGSSVELGGCERKLFGEGIKRPSASSY